MKNPVIIGIIRLMDLFMDCAGLSSFCRAFGFCVMLCDCFIENHVASIAIIGISISKIVPISEKLPAMISVIALLGIPERSRPRKLKLISQPKSFAKPSLSAHVDR